MKVNHVYKIGTPKERTSGSVGEYLQKFSPPVMCICNNVKPNEIKVKVARKMSQYRVKLWRGFALTDIGVCSAFDPAGSTCQNLIPK